MRSPGTEVANNDPEKPASANSPQPVVLFLSVGVVSTLLALSVRMSFPKAKAREHSHESHSRIGTLAIELQKLPADQQMALIQKYAKDARSSYRFAAIDALEERKGDTAATLAENAFTDNASVVRQRSIESLVVIDPERAVHLLLVALRDEDQWIRQAAIQQILSHSKRNDSPTAKAGGIDHRVIPGLIVSLSDPDLTVASGSLAALRKITGKTWYARFNDPENMRRAIREKWENWWKTDGPKWQVPASFYNVAPIRPTRIDPAPNYSLSDIDGHSLNLDGQKGKITLLNFWGPGSPPSMWELPDLQQIEETYRDKGVDTFGIITSENDPNLIRRVAKETHITYRQAIATDEILEAFGNIDDVPVSILIDKKGRLRYKWEGQRDFATIRSGIDRVLAEPD